MKKLLIGIGIILFAASCEQKSTPVVNIQPLAGGGSSGLTHITLNGLDSATAVKMIQYFGQKRKGDKKPRPACFWFSKNMINDIVNLLHSEIALQKQSNQSRTDTTDGIRFYFVSDPNVATAPLSNALIWVSTRNAGPNPKAPSGSYHKDYYEHNTIISFPFGQECNGAVSCAGTRLYDLLPPGSDPACTTTPNNITHKHARDMVKNFGKDTINTVSEWFSLSLFETAATDKNHDGLRIYYGRETGAYVPGSKVRDGRDAFVMTTTLFDSKKGIYEDDFNCNSGAKYLENYKKRYPNALTSPPLDNGELCPDNCNPIDSGSMSRPQVSVKKK